MLINTAVLRYVNVLCKVEEGKCWDLILGVQS